MNPVTGPIRPASRVIQPSQSGYASEVVRGDSVQQSRQIEAGDDPARHQTPDDGCHPGGGVRSDSLGCVSQSGPDGESPLRQGERDPTPGRVFFYRPGDRKEGSWCEHVHQDGDPWINFQLLLVVVRLTWVAALARSESLG